jgi:hypothetical protein
LVGSEKPTGTISSSFKTTAPGRQISTVTVPVLVSVVTVVAMVAVSEIPVIPPLKVPAFLLTTFLIRCPIVRLTFRLTACLVIMRWLGLLGLLLHER